MVWLVIYIVGYFASLWAMHAYKNELDLNHYDPPHDSWYDDWDSNAQAYAAMCFAWPLFWLMMFLASVWRSLVWISKKLDK